mgnify:CR=1 FL=1
MDVSIYLDFVAFLLIIVIAIFHYDKNNKKIRRYQLFNACLLLTMGTILSDIISLITIADVNAYPIWLNVLVNSIYFICINSCLSMVAAYVFFLLFEYMPEQRCYRIATGVIIVMWSILTLLVFVNIKTGCYFYFENGIYCRGPLNKLGFLVMGIEVAMLCMCYFRNRKVVTPYALLLVKSIPPIVVMLTILQIYFPHVVLTGVIAAFVNLLLFVCFQSNRIGRDALTELQNRSFFWSELNYYKEQKKNAHIILVHVKDYNLVNKHYGMKEGDAFLYNIARYLENIHSKYHVFRYGNTHFAMLGEFEDEEKSENLVTQIMERFEKTWRIRKTDWKQNIHLIHMNIKPEEIDENAKVEQFNYLLAEGKSIKENTKIFFSEEVKAAFERKNYVLEEVKKALENESFQIYLQPIYSCREKKFTSAEVLLRLFTEEGTMISPGEFIPIAEEYHLSDDITWLVLKKSMEFLAAHPQIPLETISVNMSVQQMNADYLNDKIANAQKKYGDLLYKLRIEITENVITQNPEVASRIMEYITSEGAGFYLDDFGVGFSNLSRIFDLPFEVIKLDRSLMIKIENNKKAYNILKSLVETLHNAGFQVIAEGLETENQIQKAMEIDVDKIQGFYYAKPMCERDLIEFLEGANHSKTIRK